MKYIPSISSILLLMFSPTTSISSEAVGFRTSNMDEVLMRRVDYYCVRASFRFDDPCDYFTKEDIIQKLLTLFPDADFSPLEDGKDICIVEDLHIKGTEKTL
ncbi:MAG: hypothetical protein IKH04_04960 [Kiritimatiellae bacterium]|nr:hypothetical protein [Kiritimatiellia bacterium]